MSLKWKTVNLFSNKESEEGKICVKFVRENYQTEFLPDSELLWAAAYFPLWIRAMNSTVFGFHVSYTDMAGYQLCAPDYPLWSGMPIIAWDKKRNMIGIDIYEQNDMHPSCCVPTLKKP